MKKLFIYALSLLCVVALMQACNEDSTYETTPSSDTTVYSFNFSADKNVMAQLDTVFFSIDLVEGKIFNADSMPYGTKINKLVPVLYMVDGAMSATFSFKTANGTDTVCDYLTNPTDTIDFSNGPVTLTVLSPSGTFSRQYDVKVNVHKVKADSLSWGDSKFSSLPTSLAAVTAQHTVANNNGIYCLTSDGSAFCLAHTQSPEEDNWQNSTVTLPANADINTFSASGDNLYILDADGALYESADGSAWTATGRTWSYIYGDCNGNLGGVASDSDGNLVFEQYPQGATLPIPADMPVKGTSVPVTYKAPMAQSNQCVIVGGRKANGELTNQTWSFDGSAWVKTSNKALPDVLEGLTVVPFFTYYISNVFVATEYSVFMAFGGVNSDGVNRTVYITNDYGMTWNKADELAQLPEEVTIGAFAQGFVRNSTLYPSRAIRPVEEWECPYIYIFGGVDAQGTLSNSIWRGTINRMTFKPLI